MRQAKQSSSRRSFLKGLIAAGAAPCFVPASARGADGRTAPSNRIAMGCIGMGGQGTGDMGAFLSSPECQVLAVCDVRQDNRERAKSRVDNRYGHGDCAAVNDFREITSRDDIDAVLIATPDHWHAIQACEAMRNGKDVYCEKPETLTVREGRQMVEVARRYSRIFSGGSQRVWNDYNNIHRWTWSGEIGDIQEVWCGCGGPSRDCDLPEEPVMPGLDWDLWLGPAPRAPFNRGRLNFRPWRDYSGGGMTDWGCHVFGGALFTCQLQHTGPTEIIPPDGRDVRQLTFIWANGIRMYHGTGRSGNILHVKGSRLEVPFARDERELRPPEIRIPNYKGRGGIFGDFINSVKTRELPFRDIELAHRTATVCHLGNIAYQLRRKLRWDPVKEEIIGDAEANRLLDRPKRAPWRVV
jgi:hypothetical protein